MVHRAAKFEQDQDTDEISVVYARLLAEAPHRPNTTSIYRLTLPDDSEQSLDSSPQSCEVLRVLRKTTSGNTLPPGKS